MLKEAICQWKVQERVSCLSKMVRKRVKELDLGGGASPCKTQLRRPPPPAITIYGVSQQENATSLFLFLLQQTSLHNVERDLPFCHPYLLQNNCETFMLEAASFPSDNKIVSQVVHNIMGLTQQRLRKFSLLKKTCSFEGFKPVFTL